MFKINITGTETRYMHYTIKELQGNQTFPIEIWILKEASRHHYIFMQVIAWNKLLQKRRERLQTDEKPGTFSSVEGLIYCYPDFWWHNAPAENPEMLYVTLAHELTFRYKE